MTYTHGGRWRQRARPWSGWGCKRPLVLPVCSCGWGSGVGVSFFARTWPHCLWVPHSQAVNVCKPTSVSKEPINGSLPILLHPEVVFTSTYF